MTHDHAKALMTALGRLRVATLQLGIVELTVVADIAERLLEGRKRHGNLEDKFGKGRDWRREGFEESLDRLVYDTCERLDR